MVLRLFGVQARANSQTPIAIPQAIAWPHDALALGR
jgi:hypothetical protein